MYNFPLIHSKIGLYWFGGTVERVSDGYEVVLNGVKHNVGSLEEVSDILQAEELRTQNYDDIPWDFTWEGEAEEERKEQVRQYRLYMSNWLPTLNL